MRRVERRGAEGVTGERPVTGAGAGSRPGAVGGISHGVAGESLAEGMAAGRVRCSGEAALAVSGGGRASEAGAGWCCGTSVVPVECGETGTLFAGLERGIGAGRR